MTASTKVSQEVDINWSAFTNINTYFVMASPNGVFLLTSTLDTVWVPTMAWA